ncbi:MAG: class I SAM-dependent methyltransferase [Desulfobulbaceae bacterium]|nr:class I SAM-dependent methyltransferase [Desulfobulbaceae bacterium]
MSFDATKKMSSKEFWETTKRKKYREKADVFASSLIDDNTGLVFKEFSLYRKCPLCSSDNVDVLFVKMGFPYVRCKECDMVYNNPSLNEDKNTDMYENAIHTDEYLSILTANNQRLHDENKFNYGLDIAKKHCEDLHNVLDVGCSIGVFLETAMQRGLEAYGLELNQKAYEYAQNKQLNVDNNPLGQSIFSDISFDLITLWDVLEHIVDPKILLKQIYDRLNAGGALLILTPNVNSLAARILHEKCNVFEGWAHVSLFSVETLRQVLEESGFEVVHIETILAEVNVINNHLDYQHPYLGDVHSPESVLSLLSETDILNKNLGYKSMALAIKR